MAFAEEYRRLLDSYETAVAKGDAESIGALFTPDALFLAPNQSALKGPKEIAADYASSLDGGYTVKMTIDDMQDHGKNGFGSGSFVYDGGSGKWLHILKRLEDQSLKIHRLCWN